MREAAPVGEVVEEGPELLELGLGDGEIAQAAEHLGAVGEVRPVVHLDEQRGVLRRQLLGLPLAVPHGKGLADGVAAGGVVLGDLLDLDARPGRLLLLPVILLDLLGLLLLLLLLRLALLNLLVLTHIVVVVVGGGEVLLPGVGVGPGLERALALDLGAPLGLGLAGAGLGLGLPPPLAVEAVVVGGGELRLPLERPAPAARLLLRRPLDFPAAGLRGRVGVLAGRELERGDAVGEVVQEEGVWGGDGGGVKKGSAGR